MLSKPVCSKACPIAFNFDLDRVVKSLEIPHNTSGTGELWSKKHPIPLNQEIDPCWEDFIWNSRYIIQL